MPECQLDPEDPGYPDDRRGMIIELWWDACEEEEPPELCGANFYPDVMFSADRMFAKPKRGAVHTNVDITFSPEGLPEPEGGNTWYSLRYIYDIPVQINNETGERMLVVEDKKEVENIATADLYWYNETRKRAKWERIVTGLVVPFKLTVAPE